MIASSTAERILQKVFVKKGLKGQFELSSRPFMSILDGSNMSQIISEVIQQMSILSNRAKRLLPSKNDPSKCFEVDNPRMAFRMLRPGSSWRKIVLTYKPHKIYIICEYFCCLGIFKFFPKSFRNSSHRRRCLLG